MQTKTPKTFTREALYDLVWGTPIDRLANEFGITGRGLAKICERLDIPTPPRGYWAKLAAGVKVAKFRLPPVTDTIESVTITPSEPPLVLPQPSEQVQAALDSVLAKPRGVPVPKTLRDAHQVIQGWIDGDRRRADSARLTGWAPKSIDSTPLGRRRLRILSALFKELERHAFQIKADPTPLLQAAHIESNGIRVTFSLEERIRQYRVALTPEERKDSWNQNRKWKQVREPTGELVFQITSRLGNVALPTKWQDGKDGPLESRLEEVVAGFKAAAVQLAEQEERRREAEQRHRAEELRRYELERQRRVEGKRFRYILDAAAKWSELCQARAFLDQLEALAKTEAGEGELSNEIIEWFRWARGVVDRHDPLSYSPKSLIGYNAKLTESGYPPSLGFANSLEKDTLW